MPFGRGMGLVSDKPQLVVRDKKQRLKREDHTYVKHDKSFSDWKVLVGPTDWKEHASGKISDRFRVSNLPSRYDDAGIYELGVTPPAWLPPQRSSDPVILKPQAVVVVYLGCADNVNHHLQRYGQTGAHLEVVRSTRLFTAKNDSTPNKADLEKSRSFPSAHERNTSLDRADGGYMSTRSSNASAVDGMDDADHKKTISGDLSCNSLRGPRLFSEVFALGCSVAFRWAATDSKAAAEQAEAELTEVFDYAWKRGGNFRQRSPDIVAKIIQAGTLGSEDSSSCFGDPSDGACSLFRKSPAGITIAARKPHEHPTRASISRSRTDPARGTTCFTLFQISHRPKSSEFTKLDIRLDRCGILLESGLPCTAPTVKGGKRCLHHKNSTQKRPARVANTTQLSPTHDRSGMKVSRTILSKQTDESSLMSTQESSPPHTNSSSCFPYLQSPAPGPNTSSSAPSRASSPKRRVSLSFTSWLRTSEQRLARSREWAEMATSEVGGRQSLSTYSSILTPCEESLESPCRSPCRSPWRREICGLKLDDGTVCPDPPRQDRRRCEAHKGLRNQAPKSPNRSNAFPMRAF